MLIYICEVFTFVINICKVGLYICYVGLTVRTGVRCKTPHSRTGFIFTQDLYLFVFQALNICKKTQLFRRLSPQTKKENPALRIAVFAHPGGITARQNPRSGTAQSNTHTAHPRAPYSLHPPLAFRSISHGASAETLCPCNPPTCRQNVAHGNTAPSVCGTVRSLSSHVAAIACVPPPPPPSAGVFVNVGALATAIL